MQKKTLDCGRIKVEFRREVDAMLELLLEVCSVGIENTVSIVVDYGPFHIVASVEYEEDRYHYAFVVDGIVFYTAGTASDFFHSRFMKGR